MARAEREAGNLEEAAALFERLLASSREGEGSNRERAIAHRELGETYLALGRPNAAAAQYVESLAADPEQRILHYRAGILFRQLAEHSKAARHLSAALEQGFRNNAVRFHLASAQFASGQLAAGLETARAILREHPAGGGVALRVGRLLFEFHFYRDALAAFEAALEESGSSADARVYLALTNHLLNRHGQVVELLEPVSIQGGSATAEALTLLASALASLDRFEEAEELLQRAIASEPSNPHAYWNLALVLLEQGQTEPALGWFGKMRSLAGTTRPKVFYSIRRNSCADAYQEIARHSPGRGRGANPGRGLEFLELASALGARHHHGTAVELLRIAAGDLSGDDPLPARLPRALGFSCLNLQPGSEIPARLLERAIELAPNDHQAQFLLGRAYQKRQQPEQAAEAFERAIRIKPDAAPYYTELGRLLASGSAGAEQAARAGEVLAEAIKIDPASASALFELGKLRMGQGRLDEAAEHLRRAIEAEPEFYEAYYVLGQLHARAKRPRQSRELLRIFEAKKAAIEARSTVWKDATSGIGGE